MEVEKCECVRVCVRAGEASPFSTDYTGKDEPSFTYIDILCSAVCVYKGTLKDCMYNLTVGFPF